MSYADEHRFSAPRKPGQVERKREMAEGRVVATTTEHWDGRREATVYPDVIRYGTEVHKTGSKRGKVAEVRRLSRRERKERHGDGG